MHSLVADTALVGSIMTVVGQRRKEARETVRRMLYNLILMFPSCSAAVIPLFCLMYSPFLVQHSSSPLVTGSDQQSETHSVHLATIPWTLPRHPCLSSSMLQLCTTATWALVYYLLCWLCRSLLQSPARFQQPMSAPVILFADPSWMCRNVGADSAAAGLSLPCMSLQPDGTLI